MNEWRGRVSVEGTVRDVCPLDTATGGDGGGSAGGLHVSVVATGHGLHKMWAELRITADADAPARRHRRSCEFTIDGHGDWPIATLLVTVDG